jgi:hypothetical protein
VLRPPPPSPPGQDNDRTLLADSSGPYLAFRKLLVKRRLREQVNKADAVAAAAPPAPPGAPAPRDLLCSRFLLGACGDVDAPVGVSVPVSGAPSDAHACSYFQWRRTLLAHRFAKVKGRQS